VALALAAASWPTRVPARRRGERFSPAARIAAAGGWLLHRDRSRLGLLGEPPRFGFAPALSVTPGWC
jgi:hypothetical protein